MTNTLTKERREAIRAAAENATPGPWKIAERLGLDEAWCDWHDVGPFNLTGGLAGPDDVHIANCDPQTILALLDALDAAEAKMGEPVAEALRQATELANAIWSDLDDVRRDTNLTDAWASVAEGAGRDILAFAAALYAAPPAAEPVKVKPLEWDDDGDWDGDECAANTIAGHYMIVASAQMAGKARLVFNYQADGSIYQTQLIDGVSHTEARAFAEVHHEDCIRSALVSEKEAE